MTPTRAQHLLTNRVGMKKSKKKSKKKRDKAKVKKEETKKELKISPARILDIYAGDSNGEAKIT